MLPPTSVHATRRVIVGATTERARADLAGAEAGGGAPAHAFVYKYDVQINNAREEAVEIVSRRWVVVDSEGDAAVAESGEGLGGRFGSRTHTLPPGGAIRLQGLLTTQAKRMRPSGSGDIVN